jgi:hypothetical protein
MADIDTLMGEIEALGGSQAQGPLSLGEKALGYSRSYLAGPTFNFADEAEALIASLFTGRSYSDELSQINAEQSRFKDKTDYLDNAVELFSGAALNPLQAAKALSVVKNISNPSVQLTREVVLSPVGQAAVAGFGSGNNLDERIKNAGISGALGAGASAVGNIVGEGLQTLNRQAARLKTSAFKVPYGSLQRQANKFDGPLPKAEDLPMVKTLVDAESRGIINASDGLAENANSLRDAASKVGTRIHEFIKNANDVVPPDKNFNINNTLDFVDSLSGTAKEQAEKAAMKEWESITSQFKVGSLQELQNAKMGLNYAYEKNPIAETIQKLMREDLRQEIEKRVADAGLNSTQLIGLNRNYGALEELRGVFQSRMASNLTGDIAEDIFRSQATTGGQGTANLSGNIPAIALGAAVNSLRLPSVASKTADVISNPTIAAPITAVGKLISEGVTGRNTAQVFTNYDESSDRAEQVKNSEKISVKDLLQSIDQLLERRSSIDNPDDLSSGRRSSNFGASDGARLSAQDQKQYRSNSESDRLGDPSSGLDDLRSESNFGESSDLRKRGQATEDLSGPENLESSKDSAKLGKGSQESGSQFPSKSPTDDIFNEIEALGGVTPKAQTISYEDSLMNDLFSSGVYMQEQAPRTIKEIENEIDSDPYYSALYEAESGRNPTAKNPKSTASGGFQFIKATAKALDLKDPFDLEQSFNAVRKLTGAHQEQFGDNPEVLYAAHYLGQTLLSKWKRGVELKPNEQALVKSLQDKALPRFRRIYNQVLERNKKSQITEA